MPQFSVVFKKSAEKELLALESSLQSRILDALSLLEHNPRPEGARKLQGAYDLWRIRVGRYRVLYEIQDNVLTVFVVRVSHRKDAYRRPLPS